MRRRQYIDKKPVECGLEIKAQEQTFVITPIVREPTRTINQPTKIYNCELKCSTGLDVDFAVLTYHQDQQPEPFEEHQNLLNLHLLVKQLR